METRTLPAGSTLYRIHRSVNAPIYFDADEGGRFNPRQRPGVGACYLAADPLGAFVETLRRRYLTQDDLAIRQLTSGILKRAMTLFDATARGNRFDPDVETTASLAAGDLADAQAAASELVGRADGIWYPVRHDPAGRLFGVAIFGDAGSAPTDALLTDAKTGPIPPEIIERARTEFGYEIFDTEPRLA